MERFSAREILDLFFQQHFITMVLIVVYGLKLYNLKKTKDAELRYFWMTLICCFFLVFQDIAETVASKDPGLSFFRILFSVIGYTLRPVAAVSLLLVVCPPWKTALPFTRT